MMARWSLVLPVMSGAELPGGAGESAGKENERKGAKGLRRQGNRDKKTESQSARISRMKWIQNLSLHLCVLCPLR
jgi:hypothetical protein